MITAEHARFFATMAVLAVILGLVLSDIIRDFFADAEETWDDHRLSEYLWMELTPPEHENPATAITRHDGALGEAERFI